MRDTEYGLGIDIGSAGLRAAICRPDSEPEPLLLPGGILPAVPDGSLVRVGSPVPLRLPDGRVVGAADLVADVVGRVCAAATAERGHPPVRAVLAVPPSWGPHRSAVLGEALQRTGDDGRVRLVSGALAVTYEHTRAGRLPGGATVAVYDLGGGSLDTAVVGPAADGTLRHVAVPPAPCPWGGRDMDDALLAHVLRWGGSTGGADLRHQVVGAKEQLSTDVVALLASAGGPVRLTRDELEELLAPGIDASVRAVLATIAAAGMEAGDLDAVVLAGGAARTPLVAERLSAELDRPLVRGADPELTGVLGAARLAADSWAADSWAADDDARSGPASPRPTPVRAAAPLRTPTARATAPAGATGPGRGRARPGHRIGRRATHGLVVAGTLLFLLLVGPGIGALLVPGSTPAADGAAGTSAPGAATPGADSGSSTDPVATGAAGAGGDGAPRVTGDRAAPAADTGLRPAASLRSAAPASGSTGADTPDPGAAASTSAQEPDSSAPATSAATRAAATSTTATPAPADTSPGAAPATTTPPPTAPAATTTAPETTTAAPTPAAPSTAAPTTAAPGSTAPAAPEPAPEQDPEPEPGPEPGPEPEAPAPVEAESEPAAAAGAP